MKTFISSESQNPRQINKKSEEKKREIKEENIRTIEYHTSFMKNIVFVCMMDGPTE